MKSNINKKQDAKNNLILSIGMIVKNEERVLRRCMESLVSLRAQLPCELIIADTGSTDGTFAIAEEYADQAFHFEWTNDFAAARNATLERASGEWFMFLDADEYFDEDISEFVAFMQRPELRAQYNTGELLIRSFLDFEKSQFADAYLPRVVKRFPDTTFVGKIHEGIPIRSPLVYFSSIVFHTGYVYATAQQHSIKRERNMTLMLKEYESGARNVRLLCHLCDGAGYDPQLKKKFVDEAVAMAKDPQCVPLYRNIAFVLAVAFYESSNPELALQLCDAYYENTTADLEKQMATVEIWMRKAKILDTFGRCEEAIEAYQHYFKVYHAYTKHELDIEDSTAHPIAGVTPYEYQRMVFICALCYAKLERYDEALAQIRTLSVEEVEPKQYKEFFGTYRKICLDSKRYGVLVRFYAEIVALGDPDKTELALYMMSSSYYYRLLHQERIAFAQEVVESGVTGDFVTIMQLVLDQETMDITLPLTKFVNGITRWSDGYAETIFLAMKYQIDLSDVIAAMPVAKMHEVLEAVAQANYEFAEYALAYCEAGHFLGTMKQFTWMITMLLIAVERCASMSHEEQVALYRYFTMSLADYVMNLYNPELLNPEDIEALPTLHAFGYYMGLAYQALECGEKKLYIRNLKLALQHHEPAKTIISVLLEDFQEQLRTGKS